MASANIDDEVFSMLDRKPSNFPNWARLPIAFVHSYPTHRFARFGLIRLAAHHQRSNRRQQD